MPIPDIISNICCNSLRTRALFALYTTLVASIFLIVLTVIENHNPIHANPLPEFGFIWPILSVINFVASFSSIVEVYKSDVQANFSNPNAWLRFFAMTQVLNVMIGVLFMFEILRRRSLIKYCQYIIDRLSKNILSVEEVKKLQQAITKSASLVGFIFWFVMAALIVLFTILALMARDYQEELKIQIRNRFNESERSDIPLVEVQPIPSTSTRIPTPPPPYYDAIQKPL